MENKNVAAGADSDAQDTSKSRKVSIKASEMSVEMMEKAVLLADEAMQKYNDDGDIAQHIKNGFDLMCPPWHCVVGRKFSSLITHEHGYFLYFFIGKLACVLFKARD
uniref:Dynein light chain n=1 Tax=Panagrolaimus sp. ES5 TaxID=591445 RepID=A0AC34F4B6_9BILA